MLATHQQALQRSDVHPQHEEWERKADDGGRCYYIDHTNQAVDRLPPAAQWPVVDALPYGIERAVHADDQFEYFLDHTRHISTRIDPRDPDYETKIMVCKVTPKLARRRPPQSSSPSEIPIISVAPSQQQSCEAAAKQPSAEGEAHAVTPILQSAAADTPPLVRLKVYLHCRQYKTINCTPQSTARDLVAQLASKCDIRSHDLFALVLQDTRGGQPWRWLRPAQTVHAEIFKAGPIAPECHLRFRFYPRDLDKLRVRDPVAFQFLFDQAERGVAGGELPDVPADLAVQLAAFKVQLWLKACEKKKFDMTYLEKKLGLANLLSPAVLAVTKIKDIKARFKAELKYNAALSAEQVQLRYLELLSSRVASFGGAYFDVILNCEPVRLLINPRDGITCVHNQPSSNQTLALDFADIKAVQFRLAATGHSGRTLELMTTVADKSSTVELSATEDLVLDDLLAFLDGYFRLFVNIHGSLIPTAQAQYIATSVSAPFATATTATTSVVGVEAASAKAKVLALTGLGLPIPNIVSMAALQGARESGTSIPLYKDVHHVTYQGWNYKIPFDGCVTVDLRQSLPNFVPCTVTLRKTGVNLLQGESFRDKRAETPATEARKVRQLDISPQEETIQQDTVKQSVSATCLHQAVEPATFPPVQVESQVELLEIAAVVAATADTPSGFESKTADDPHLIAASEVDTTKRLFEDLARDSDSDALDRNPSEAASLTVVIGHACTDFFSSSSALQAVAQNITEEKGVPDDHPSPTAQYAESRSDEYSQQQPQPQPRLQTVTPAIISSIPPNIVVTEPFIFMSDYPDEEQEVGANYFLEHECITAFVGNTNTLNELASMDTSGFGVYEEDMMAVQVALRGSQDELLHAFDETDNGLEALMRQGKFVDDSDEDQSEQEQENEEEDDEQDDKQDDEQENEEESQQQQQPEDKEQEQQNERSQNKYTEYNHKIANRTSQQQEDPIVLALTPAASGEVARLSLEPQFEAGLRGSTGTDGPDDFCFQATELPPVWDESLKTLRHNMELDSYSVTPILGQAAKSTDEPPGCTFSETNEQPLNVSVPQTGDKAPVLQPPQSSFADAATNLDDSTTHPTTPPPVPNSPPPETPLVPLAPKVDVSPHPFYTVYRQKQFELATQRSSELCMPPPPPPVFCKPEETMLLTDSLPISTAADQSQTVFVPKRLPNVHELLLPSSVAPTEPTQPTPAEPPLPATLAAKELHLRPPALLPKPSRKAPEAHLAPVSQLIPPAVSPKPRRKTPPAILSPKPSRNTNMSSQTPKDTSSPDLAADGSGYQRVARQVQELTVTFATRLFAVQHGTQTGVTDLKQFAIYKNDLWDEAKLFVSCARHLVSAAAQSRAKFDEVCEDSLLTLVHLTQKIELTASTLSCLEYKGEQATMLEALLHMLHAFQKLLDGGDSACGKGLKHPSMQALMDCAKNMASAISVFMKTLRAIDINQEAQPAVESCAVSSFF